MDDSSKFLKLQKEFEDYRSDKEREIANLEDELEELESKLIHTQQTTSDDPECPGSTFQTISIILHTFRKSFVRISFKNWEPIAWKFVRVERSSK